MNVASPITAAVLLAALFAEPRAGEPVRGISGAIEFRAAGPRIRARPNQSHDSPILVRVADARADEGGEHVYRVEFIGLVAGDYDLRDYLERQDGSPVDDIAPLRVYVVSQLPPDHGTDLFSSAQAPRLTATQYRLVMAGLGVAWLSVPIAYLVVRAIRRRPTPPPPAAAPAPTLADQLRPLAEAAIQGTLSIAERGRLELLMYLYWRGRRGWDGSQAQVVPRLRNDSEAGLLLRAIESWLHASPVARSHADRELAALLKPYCDIPPLRTHRRIPPPRRGPRETP